MSQIDKLQAEADELILTRLHDYFDDLEERFALKPLDSYLVRQFRSHMEKFKPSEEMVDVVMSYLRE